MSESRVPALKIGSGVSAFFTERPQPGQKALISGISAEQYEQIMQPT
jgi:hypothetical protein